MHPKPPHNSEGLEHWRQKKGESVGMVSKVWDWLHGPVSIQCLCPLCLLQSPRVCPSPHVTPLRLGFPSPLLSRVMLERIGPQNVLTNSESQIPLLPESLFCLKDRNRFSLIDLTLKPLTLQFPTRVEAFPWGQLEMQFPRPTLRDRHLCLVRELPF